MFHLEAVGDKQNCEVVETMPRQGSFDSRLPPSPPLPGKPTLLGIAADHRLAAIHESSHPGWDVRRIAGGGAACSSAPPTTGTIRTGKPHAGRLAGAGCFERAEGSRRARIPAGMRRPVPCATGGGKDANDATFPPPAILLPSLPGWLGTT